MIGRDLLSAEKYIKLVRSLLSKRLKTVLERNPEIANDKTKGITYTS